MAGDEEGCPLAGWEEAPAGMRLAQPLGCRVGPLGGPVVLAVAVVMVSSAGAVMKSVTSAAPLALATWRLQATSPRPHPGLPPPALPLLPRAALPRPFRRRPPVLALSSVAPGRPLRPLGVSPSQPPPSPTRSSSVSTPPSSSPAPLCCKARASPRASWGAPGGRSRGGPSGSLCYCRSPKSPS